MKKKIGLIVSLALVIVFYALAVTMPATELLTPASYVYAGVFLSVIVLLLTQALPDWVVVIGASALMILTDAVFRKTGLQSAPVFTMSGLFGAFSGSTVWLIIMVFALSAGIGKSGLLNRIAIGKVIHYALAIGLRRQALLNHFDRAFSNAAHSASIKRVNRLFTCSQNVFQRGNARKHGFGRHANGARRGNFYGFGSFLQVALANKRRAVNAHGFHRVDHRKPHQTRRKNTHLLGILAGRALAERHNVKLDIFQGSSQSRSVLERIRVRKRIVNHAIQLCSAARQRTFDKLRVVQARTAHRKQNGFIAGCFGKLNRLLNCNQVIIAQH